MDKLRKYIDEIANKEIRYGDKLNSAALDDEILRLIQESQSLNNCQLSEIYVEILRLTDGIDHNGYVLYASHTRKIVGYDDRFVEGFVEANKLWSDYSENGDHNYIMYGETGLSLYVHNRATNLYQVIDRVSADSHNDYQKPEELFEKLFKDMLELPDED